MVAAMVPLAGNTEGWMRTLLLSSLAAGVLAFSTGAHAAVTYSSPSTLSLINFGTSATPGLVTTTSPGTINGETFTFTTSASTPQTGIYSGSTTAAASPFGFSSNTNYLAVEPGGSITITFAASQTAFALLWGTVDDYNSLKFQVGGTTIGGSDVANALGFPANGTVNKNVLISGLSPFTSVLVTSGQVAFEFAPGTPVPEPVSLALLGTGLVGLGLARRRRSGDMAA